MSLFMSEIVTPAAHLPIKTTDEPLAAAVVEEIERTILWRAIVSQERRILIDGPLPPIPEIEPVTALVSLTKYTPADAAAVIDAASYAYVSRDPAGTRIAPLDGTTWPAPERSIGSFALTYLAGWTVTPETALLADDAVNEVPASVQLLIERAVSFRAGAGLGNIGIGSLQLDVEPSYSTDQLPREIASIGRAYQYRPGIIAARP